ncbi:MAG TPA: hypothetical protein VM077_05605 [Candidatus Limnocylindrales bacterium]|nr:hypothetical protein [Candidatus Limnocylindrales bacterium]
MDDPDRNFLDENLGEVENGGYTPPEIVDKEPGGASSVATKDKLVHVDSVIQTPKDNPLQILAIRLQIEHESIKTIINAEPVVDQEGFERTRFIVGDGVSIIFRGREQLPEFPDSSSDRKTVVLTVDEKPLQTSGEDFDAWLAKMNSGRGEPVKDTGFETEILASTSPLGIVDASLQLIDQGVGKAELKPDLENLRQKIKTRQIDDAVLNLFDQIYVSGAVDTATGLVFGNNMEGVGTHNLSVDGPMLVALALGGDEQAIRILDLKREVVNFIDESDIELATMPDGGIEPKIKPGEKRIKQPGEALTTDEIDLIKNAHLVAAHTTGTRPEVTDTSTGISTVRPTGEYNIGEDSQYPRSTIHWSLNHAVESHIRGNFNDRPFTVVAPLDELARMNGAPAVLYGVDTYFSLNPGNGLSIPENATIIETHMDESSKFISKEGNTVRLRDRDITSEDLKELVEYVHVNFIPDYPGDVASLIAGDLIATGQFDSLSKNMDKIDNPTSEDMDPENQELLNQWRPLVSLVKAEISANPNLKTSEGTAIVLKKLLNGDIPIQEHSDLEPLLTEATRRFLVNKTVESYGGKVVKSDGNSAYIEDEAFREKEEEIASTIGIRLGKHTDLAEGKFEDTYSKALSKALTVIPSDQELSESSDETATFNWAKYDDKAIWGSLYQAPWQTRRWATSMGLLTFSTMPTRRLTRDINDDGD